MSIYVVFTNDLETNDGTYIFLGIADSTETAERLIKLSGLDAKHCEIEAISMNSLYAEDSPSVTPKNVKEDAEEFERLNQLLVSEKESDAPLNETEQNLFDYFVRGDCSEDGLKHIHGMRKQFEPLSVEVIDRARKNVESGLTPFVFQNVD